METACRAPARTPGVVGTPGYIAAVDLAIAILGTVGTLIAAVAAVGSWKAAARSDKAASQMTAIERDRRHGELTPQLRFQFKDPGNGQPLLRVYLDGPPSLNRLDRIELTVRDDMPNRAQFATIGTVTPEQVAKQVWGPYKFVRGVDGASQDGRTMAPFELLVGESRPFAMEPTSPPPWSNDQADWWRNQYKGTPLRIALVCHRDGYEPWTLKFEVQLEETKALESGTAKELLPAAEPEQ